MKLPGINYNWRVGNLAQRDIYAPQKVANAEANAARAWAGTAGAKAGAAGQEANAARAIGRVYEQVGGYVTKAMMDIQRESNESEAQTAYNNSIMQLNELENKLYTSESLKMEDPVMEGIKYDDSYSVVDGDKIEVLNTGYAPLYEVGQRVWESKSKAIVKNFYNGMSKGAQGIYQNKIQAQLTSKTQNMGRHVLKLGVADQKSKIDFSIEESNRIGDTAGAIRIAEESFKRGIIDRKQTQKYTQDALQGGDILRFNQELSITNDEAGLARLSNVALFSNNYMTPAQKAQASNNALNKIRQNKAEARTQLSEWRDNNEMDAIIEHHKGNMTTTDLISSPNKYGRASFTRLYNRFQKVTPVISDQSLIRSFGEEIVGVNFENADPEVRYREIVAEMGKSVKNGDISPEDYAKFNKVIEQQSKMPFNRQPYQETKKSLFVDMLGTLDANTIEEINNAGPNISSIMLQKFGQSKNLAVLAIRAFEDLNAYVRQSGPNADPIGWWKENKKNYKDNNTTESSSWDFNFSYPQDSIKLSNGALDIKSTQENIVRNYQNGAYGIVGSTEAKRELDRRASILDGNSLWEMEND